MSSISNLNRMSGLMSGLDTEALVKAMTANTKARIDSQKQKIQILQWRQESYRSVISKINDFKDKYLNILSPTSIKAQAVMNKYSATSSNDKRITATAAPGAAVGKYTISQAATAKTASITSDYSKGPVAAGEINLDFSKNIKAKPYKVEVELDGSKKTITFKGGADAEESKANFLAAINDAFSGAIGSSQGFVLEDGEKEGTATLKFNGNDDGILHTFSVGYNSEGLGLANTAYSRISTAATLGSISFAQELKSENGKYNININGVDFEFNENTTISEMMSTINSSDAGVKMSFSSVSQSFTLESKETGAAANITVSQTNGNLLNALFNRDESWLSTSDADSSKKITYEGLQYPSASNLTAEITEMLKSGDFGENDGIYEVEIKYSDGEAYTLKLNLKEALEEIRANRAAEGEDGEEYDEEAGFSVDEITEAFNSAFQKAYSEEVGGTYTGNIFTYQEDEETGVGALVIWSRDLGVEFKGEDFNGLNNYKDFDAQSDYIIAEGVDEMKFIVDGKEVTVKAKRSEGIAIGDLIKAGVFIMPVDGTLMAAGKVTAVDDNAKDLLREYFGGKEELSGVNSETFNGSNATITVSSDGEHFNTYTSASNLFEFDGTTIDVTNARNFDAEGNYDDYITIEVSKDTSGIMDVVKNFVNDYNTLLADLYGETSTARPKSGGSYYDPLTDDMEEEMSDKEIEKWNEQAKIGWLYNDRHVQTFLSNIRGAMNTYVDGFGLADMGITLSKDWKDNGKLEINESQLESAINAYGDKITDFFTKASDGLAAKLENVVDRAISTSSDKYGYLSALAGIEGTKTNNDNQIYREISAIQKIIDRLNERYEKEQKRYWDRFTALETYMAQAQAQMSYFTDNSTNGG